MPTYHVTAPRDFLSAERKAVVARAITTTHNAVTGARSFFAQVLFTDVAPGDWFMGGAPMVDDQVFVHGHIRGGRSAETKHRLVTGLRDVLAATTGLPATRVWCYLAELPPAHMVEYGHVLPEPGDEAAWMDRLPAEDRAMMERVDRPS